VLSHEIAGLQAPIPLAPLLELAHARPDLKALQSEASAAERETALRKAERWADPTIGLHYRHERSRFDEPTVISDDADFVGLQIKVPLPLLYANEGEIAASAARKRVAEARRDSVLVDIDREVRDAHQRATRELAAIRGLERGVKAATTGERLAEQAYQEGLIGAVQLLQTQQQRFAAEDARNDALEAYYEALSDLEGAIDAPLEQALAGSPKVQP
jgi:outer membrane protein TolC